jgi:hypothetical protein
MPEQPLAILSDRAKVERIFQNIFNNAVKFTTDGDIKVKANPSADGLGVEFEVADTGVGIEKSKMALIFEPFQQIDKSAQRSCSGLGLGLTVARRMAHLIGGTVEISSEAGVGTRVTMRFPSQQSRTTTVLAEERRYG